MKKTNISFYFIFISLLTLLTIFFSVVQKSYFNFTAPQELVANNALLTNFNPNLDLTVISTIESKNKNTDESFDFSIIKNNQTLNETTPTPTATPTPKNTTQTSTIITPTPTTTSTPQNTSTSTSIDTPTSQNTDNLGQILNTATSMPADAQTQ